MIQPFLNHLAKLHIVLGSGSPRRQEILKTIGLAFEVVPSAFEENLDIGNFESAIEFVKETAKQKALDVVRQLKARNCNADLVIGADTVVVFEEEMFGKPKTKVNAINMLKKLSGNRHKVYTGVTLVLPKMQPNGDGCYMISFYEETGVVMCIMPENVIQAYVDTGEPLDKAGGYGIQGIGGSLVEAIHGDYYNVMGFPLHRFCKEVYNLYLNGTLES